MGFATSLLTTKLRNLHEGVVKTIAKWDPDAVGAAQLEEWDIQAKNLARTAATAQEEAKVAVAALSNIKENFERYRAAAEKLQEAGNEVAAEKAANQAFEWHEKIESATSESNDAQEWAKEVLEAAQRAQKLVIEGREKIAAAKRDQDRALREAEVAETRRKDRERVAGINKGFDGTNAALDAMASNAKDARIKAAADNIRSDVLGKATEADADVIEALKEVDGTNKPQTFAEKMAALKNL